MSIPFPILKVVLMSWWTIFKKNDWRSELEKEYQREKNEIRLDAERRRKEIELTVKEKRSQLEAQRLEYEIQRARAELDEALGVGEALDEIEGDSDSEAIKMGMDILDRFKGYAQPPANSTPENYSPQISTVTPAGIHYTDEEIETIYQAADKSFIAAAKAMPAALVEKFIKQKIPNIDEDTLKRAIARVKR